MGGDGKRLDQSYIVETGPYANGLWRWVIQRHLGGPIENKDWIEESNCFSREVWDSEQNAWVQKEHCDPTNLDDKWIYPKLPSAEDVENTLSEGAYKTFPWDSDEPWEDRRKHGFDVAIQNLHTQVLKWVGGKEGDMSVENPGRRPNDPVFFLHHCYLDKLWADWQDRHSHLSYLPDDHTLEQEEEWGREKFGPQHWEDLKNMGQRFTHPGEIIGDQLSPWNTRISDVLDHYRMGYCYDESSIDNLTLTAITHALLLNGR
jgi:hypothetical protein